MRRALTEVDEATRQRRATVNPCYQVRNPGYSLDVEANGRRNVLVVREPVGDHVRVIDDVAAEQQATTSGEDEVHGAAEGNEDPNDAGHHCSTSQCTVLGMSKRQDMAYEEQRDQQTGKIQDQRSHTIASEVRQISNPIWEDRVHTFDWSVKRVRPRNTPTVINLQVVDI